MIRIYLKCGHTFETGRLEEAEETNRITYCPICRKTVLIEKAYRLTHPPNRKKWVEGVKEIDWAINKPECFGNFNRESEKCVNKCLASINCVLETYRLGKESMNHERS